MDERAITETDPVSSEDPVSVSSEDSGSSEESLDPRPFTDDELTRLALAADPDAGFDPGAEPFGVGDRGAALLPEWYMPATMRSDTTSSRGRRWVVAGIVAALLLVNGAGLCVTYGVPEIAW